MKTKKLFCAFAVVATAFAMASCQSELVEEMIVDLNINVTATTTPEFEATIEDNCGNKVSTRTAVSSSPNSNGNYTLSWQAGDEISITDGYTSAIYATDNAGSNATFTRKSGNISCNASSFKAFYPSSLNPQNLELPLVQEYILGNVKNFPMYAETCNKTLSFKNLCGIFRLCLKNETGSTVKVKNVSVLADGRGLAGSFSIDNTGAAVVCGNNGVTLLCACPVELSACNGTDFNVILPKGDYCSLKLKITTEDGKVINMKSNSTISIRRSGITKVCVSLKPTTFDGGLEDITFCESDVDFSER